jgi:uncharacterized protein (UPF0333 family)
MGILKKKGQAALEFLTTYGWAFMVILVMIGALAYFGVLNPSKLVPDQCIASSGFTCTDAAARATANAAGNSMDVLLTANRGDTVTLSGLNVTIGGTDQTTALGCSLVDKDGNAQASFDVADAEKFGVSCATLPTAQNKKGAKLKADVKFTYKLADGLDHTGSASLTTTVQD